MKNTIVVTGGAGFVGSNLVSLLLKKTKYKIISIDDYSSGSKRNHIKNSRLTYLKSHSKNISNLLNIIYSQMLQKIHNLVQLIHFV